MKTTFALFLIMIFISSAHASDDCNSLLSDHMTVSIQDLAKLRFNLDSKIALGESNIVIRGLQNSFVRKRAELQITSSLGLEAIDFLLKEEIAKLQQINALKTANWVQDLEAQKIAKEVASTRVTVAGHLTRMRLEHRVSLLSGDRVLIMGGSPGRSDSIKEIEIYDPQTNHLEVLGNLIKPRKAFSHLKMANGKIVIWSGWGASSYLDSFEVIDPALKTIEPMDFTFSGTGPVIRVSETQFLQKQTQKNWKLVDMGAQRIDSFSIDLDGYAFSSLREGDVIFSLSGKFYTLNESRSGLLMIGSSEENRVGAAQITEHDDHVVVTGGMLFGKGRIALDSIERFNPFTGVSEIIGHLQYPRWNHTMAVTPDHRIVVFGGYGPDGPVTQVELIDPVSGETTVIGDTQPLGIYPQHVVLSNGDILVMGESGTDLVEHIKVGTR